MSEYKQTMLLRTVIRKPYTRLVNLGRSLSNLHSCHVFYSSVNKFSTPLSRAFSSDDKKTGVDDHDKAKTLFDAWDLSSTGADNSDPFTLEEENGGVEMAEVEPWASRGGDLRRKEDSWVNGGGGEEDGGVFTNLEKEVVAGEKEGSWTVADGYKQWTLGEDGEEEGGEKGKGGDLFDIGEVDDGDVGSFGEEGMVEGDEDREKLLMEEHELKGILKGPKHAFGDLIAASGITNAMLDNLIALKDFKGVEGLPPLSVIEDIRYEKNTRKTTRADVERQKQEEIAKARVRQVDDKGRAYATGRRKCSIARVWVQPGTGNFTVNDKQFDLYFPDLGHRATLLRPFSETNTLGSWDVNCTVKGGGVSGQVGAVRLGISRALQNLNPGFRPSLKAAGFLKRDPRVVERKKPGKAKARKSFQWVKR